MVSVHSVQNWAGVFVQTMVQTEVRCERGKQRKIEKGRERERDREIEHFSGAFPRREYEWLIVRAAASGRELRAFVCPPLAETREVSRT